MPFDSISASAPSIFVSTPEELAAVYSELSSASGGTIYLTDDFPANGVISLGDPDTDGGKPVHITSANPDDPVQVGRIVLDEASNLKFSHLHVDASSLGISEWSGHIEVESSSDIAFDQMTLTSNGSSFFDPRLGSSVHGGRGLLVHESDGVSFTNSTLSQHFQAITLLESENLLIEGNEITANQGDGIKMAEVQQVVIKDNYLHDFATSPNEVNHGDFIQLCAPSSITDTISMDVVITGNVLDTGNGTSLQGIWLRNEKYDATGNANDLYKNITVTDNLIYTGSPNGIGLGAVDGAVISNNTLLWNQDAYTMTASKGDVTFKPQIRIDGDARDVLVSDNITPMINDEGADMSQTGNVLISYENASDPNYVGTLFPNVGDGGEIALTDMRLAYGTSLAGKGAAITQTSGTGTVAAQTPPPPVVVIPDVPAEPEPQEPVLETPVQPEPEPEPEPEEPAAPTFSDGDAEIVVTPPVAEAPAPAPLPPEPTFVLTPPEPVVVETPVVETPVVAAPEPVVEPPVVLGPPPETEAFGKALLAMDFSDALLADISGYDSDVQVGSIRHMVNEGDNIAYQIGDKQMIRFDVDNEQQHNLDSFGFEMDIRVLSPTDTGRFLHFPGAFEAEIEKDGTVTFTLRTDEGKFTLNSGTQIFDDGAMHKFAVGYDSAAGELSMVVDGVVLDKTAASGETADGLYHGLTIGTNWGNSVNAVVDNIYLGDNPLDAGVDLDLEVGDVSDPYAGYRMVDGGVQPAAPAGDEADIAAPDAADALFATSFEGSKIVDQSDYDSLLISADEDGLVANETGQGYLISDDSRVSMNKKNLHIHELDSFGLRLDIQLLEEDDTGRFLHFPSAFEASVEKDKSITFELITDAGKFSVNSGATNFSDMAMHSFAVGYDSADGRLTMEIDGKVVDSTAATGSTTEMVHHGLTIGSVWGDSVTAVVDNVWFGEDPAAVGVDTTAGVIFALESTAVDAALAGGDDAALDDVEIEDDLLIA